MHLNSCIVQIHSKFLLKKMFQPKSTSQKTFGLKLQSYPQASQIFMKNHNNATIIALVIMKPCNTILNTNKIINNPIVLATVLEMKDKMTSNPLLTHKLCYIYIVKANAQRCQAIVTKIIIFQPHYSMVKKVRELVIGEMEV